MNSISFPSPTQYRLNSSKKPLVSSLSPQVLFNFSRVITSKRYQINAWNKRVAAVFYADQRVENHLRRGAPTLLTYVQQPPTNHSQPLRYIPAMARTWSGEEAGNLSSSSSDKDSKKRRRDQRDDDQQPGLTDVSPIVKQSETSGRPKKVTKPLPNESASTQKALQFFIKGKEGPTVRECYEKLKLVGLDQVDPLFLAAFHIFGVSSDMREAWMALPEIPEVLRGWIGMTAKSLGLIK
ncbi:hypothetical protein HanIR_Chr17g0894021 [Helianthus annuus]|nr:hypothetical protein HanIR_Chr17g0894021 [Helianthus annuus]